MTRVRTRSKRHQKKFGCANNENWRRSNGDTMRHGRRSLENPVLPLVCQHPEALRRQKKPTGPTGPAATDQTTDGDEDVEVCIVPTVGRKARLAAYRSTCNQLPESCSIQTIRRSQAQPARGGRERTLRTLANQILDGMKIKLFEHREVQIAVEEEDLDSLAVEAKLDDLYYSY